MLVAFNQILIEYFLAGEHLNSVIAIMQYKHSFLVTWSYFLYLFQHVEARVANPQDELAKRNPTRLDEETSLFGEAQKFSLGKRQEICVYDAYLQALDDLSLAIDLCGQIIGLPVVTVVVDSTPVMYKTMQSLEINFQY